MSMTKRYLESLPVEEQDAILGGPNEQVDRAINNTAKSLEDAYRVYMADVDPAKAQEAFEPLMDACRKLLSIVQNQQSRIAKLEKTMPNSEVI